MARQYVDIKIHEPALRTIDEKQNISYDFKSSAIESIHTTTKLNYAFFSKSNMDIVQNAIRYQVWQRTGKKHVIARQSDTELGIIMRAYYLQYGKNLPTDIPEQVQELNNIVIEYLVPKIIIQINQYVSYLNDISTPYKIIEYPTNTAIRGEKSFNMARFI
jgi:hypothetical protein